MGDIAGSRFATVEDLPITTGFVLLAHDEVRDERGGRWLLAHDIDRRTAQEQHQQALQDDSRCLVVGLIDEVVVGHAMAVLSSAIDARLCMIDELFVHPQARAIGVGSQMLALVRQWAIENHCAAIESYVLPGNRSGKNFFERVGMKTRKMRVSADL